MRTALVTGANGFIGAALSQRLRQDGIAVRALCRSAQKGATLVAAGATVIQGDVQDAAVLLESAEGCDVIFHVAAVGSGSWQHQFGINVQGSRNVVETAAQVGAQRMVHVSTIGVYGYNVDAPIVETYPQTPPRLDYYMRTKALGEAVVWQIAGQHGLPLSVVRPAYVYGPRSAIWTLGLYALCRRYPVPHIARGQGLAHPIYIDDVVDLLVTAATHPGAPGNAFHAAPDPAPTWDEFLGYYARMAHNQRVVNIPLPPRVILKPLGDGLSLLRGLMGAPNDIYGAITAIGRHATFRMDRAHKILGWQPRISLEEGMALTERWLKQEIG